MEDHDDILKGLSIKVLESLPDPDNMLDPNLSSEKFLQDVEIPQNILEEELHATISIPEKIFDEIQPCTTDLNGSPYIVQNNSIGKSDKLMEDSSPHLSSDVTSFDYSDNRYSENSNTNSHDDVVKVEKKSGGGKKMFESDSASGASAGSTSSISEDNSKTGYSDSNSGSGSNSGQSFDRVSFSQEDTSFVPVLPAESISNMAKSVGIEISNDIALALGAIAMERLRTTIRYAKQFNRHERSSGLRVRDFKKAEQLHEYHSYGHMSRFKTSFKEYDYEIDLLASVGNPNQATYHTSEENPTFNFHHAYYNDELTEDNWLSKHFLSYLKDNTIKSKDNEPKETEGEKTKDKEEEVEIDSDFENLNVSDDSDSDDKENNSSSSSSDDDSDDEAEEDSDVIDEEKTNNNIDQKINDKMETSINEENESEEIDKNLNKTLTNIDKVKDKKIEKYFYDILVDYLKHFEVDSINNSSSSDDSDSENSENAETLEETDDEEEEEEDDDEKEDNSEEEENDSPQLNSAQNDIEDINEKCSNASTPNEEVVVEEDEENNAADTEDSSSSSDEDDDNEEEDDENENSSDSDSMDNDEIFNYINEDGKIDRRSIATEWVWFMELFVRSFFSEEEPSEIEKSEKSDFQKLLDHIEKFGCNPVLKIICDFLLDYMDENYGTVKLEQIQKILNVIDSIIKSPISLNKLQMEIISLVLIKVLHLPPPQKTIESLQKIFVKALKKSSDNFEELKDWIVEYVNQALKITSNLPVDELSESYKLIFLNAISLINCLEISEVKIIYESKWIDFVILFLKNIKASISTNINETNIECDNYIEQSSLSLFKYFLTNYYSKLSNDEFKTIQRELKDLFGEKLASFPSSSSSSSPSLSQNQNLNNNKGTKRRLSNEEMPNLQSNNSHHNIDENNSNFFNIKRPKLEAGVL